MNPSPYFSRRGKFWNRLGLSGLLAGTGLSLVLAQAAPNPTADAWVAPARAARKPNPVAANEKSLALGKELYTAACLPCHGPAGKGDGPAASTLERNGVPVRPGNLSDPKMWQQTDGAIFWKLSEGRTPMPAWGQAIPEDQLWAIVNYVRTLAKKPEADGNNHNDKTPTNQKETHP